MTRTLVDDNIDLIRISTARSMAADSNRNHIVSGFLKTTADWLFWIDTDNVTPIGGIRRLLDNRKEIVSGLYYQKSKEQNPVAYLKVDDNRYVPIENWTRGELVPVAAAGLGAVLVHRSVYEKIQDEFVILQRHTGGITTLHKDDVRGKVPTTLAKNGPELVNGVYRERLIQPTWDVEYFPHHILEYGRTEDMKFYEDAQRVGFVPYVDTFVEVDHLRWNKVTGATHRETVRNHVAKTTRMTEYLDVEMLDAPPTPMNSEPVEAVIGV